MKFSGFRRTTRFTAITLATIFALGACSSSPSAILPATTPMMIPGSAPDATQGDQTTPKFEGELTVFAAASLQGAVNALTAEFAVHNPGITFAAPIYDGSSTLATQLIAGAQADILATADERTMASVVDEDLVAGQPEKFATNELVIAVAPENPLGITDLADIGDDGKAPIVVICAVEVPCGNASKNLLDVAKVTLTPASEEQNVSAVLAKIRGGEADAGLVYRTDVLSTKGEVDAVDIAGASDNPNIYPIAVLKGSSNAAAAEGFNAFVRSPVGIKILTDMGFGTP